MSLVTRPSLLLRILLLGLFAPVLALADKGWPKGFIVAEDSKSPDGHYGVLIPSHDAAAPEDDADIVNYLADFKTHRLLGKIHGAIYSEGLNHRSMAVHWAKDSTWGVIEYDARFGFHSIVVIEPNGDSFTQTEIGSRVQKDLNAAIAKESRNDETGGDAGVYFRLASDRKLRVRALSWTNPKMLEDRKTFYALFQGTYNLDAKAWKVTDARSIPEGLSDALQAAYDDANYNQTVFENDQSRAIALDLRMNDVYRAVRFILGPDRFATVKQDQYTWLKNRDATPSVAERCRMMEARIKALQDLVW